MYKTTLPPVSYLPALSVVFRILFVLIGLEVKTKTFLNLFRMGGEGGIWKKHVNFINVLGSS